MQCSWCPSLNRCSTGTDRKRQEWVQNGCERSLLKESSTCPREGEKGNNYSSQQQVTTPSITNSDQNNGAINLNASKSIDVKKAALSHNDSEQSKSNHASFALGILLPIIVVASLVMWVFYAYRNPHTKSGQLLIQVKFIYLFLAFPNTFSIIIEFFATFNFYVHSFVLTRLFGKILEILNSILYHFMQLKHIKVRECCILTEYGVESYRCQNDFNSLM